MSFELLKLQIARKIGENVLYAGEIEKIILNLGGKQKSYKIKSDLKNIRIDPRNCGIDMRYFICREVKVYPFSKVWVYLQTLEKEGKIELVTRGIENMEDIIEREYNHYNPFDRNSFRKDPKHLLVDETSGFWDNTIKRYEEN